LGAINDPSDDGAEGLLIELGFLLKERGELVVPVVVVDCLLGGGPLSEHVEHILVVLVISGGDIGNVDISLLVVEVKFPLGCWLEESSMVASTTGAAVFGRCELRMVVRATVASVSTVPLAPISI
jgi:hypothetical protein